MDKMSVFFSAFSCDVCTEHRFYGYKAMVKVTERMAATLLSDTKDAPKGVLQI